MGTRAYHAADMVFLRLADGQAVVRHQSVKPCEAVAHRQAFLWHVRRGRGRACGGGLGGGFGRGGRRGFRAAERPCTEAIDCFIDTGNFALAVGLNIQSPCKGALEGERIFAVVVSNHLIECSRHFRASNHVSQQRHRRPFDRVDTREIIACAFLELAHRSAHAGHPLQESGLFLALADGCKGNRLARARLWHALQVACCQGSRSGCFGGGSETPLRAGRARVFFRQGDWFKVHCADKLVAQVEAVALPVAVGKHPIAFVCTRLQ